jgi:hypothetical protein
MKRNTIINFVIILLVIVLVIFILNRKAPTIDTNVAKCIGTNSQLYTQLGCSHCKTQEDMFGSNLKYLNITDCFYEQDKCTNITATPTWIIKGQTYLGVQSIETLQNLTGCK